eukprot:TRINITY_DN19729_c0_g1_i2.p1 TRINITY_DN19729_c0_g1~~TRINITY_DN19729_c0_g1_i2.p1  ORF type:complete len:229 (-),score=25.88 TRINITY_DN19729_c0_g1_i2:68-730(-)
MGGELTKLMRVLWWPWLDSIGFGVFSWLTVVLGSLSWMWIAPTTCLLAQALVDQFAELEAKLTEDISIKYFRCQLSQICERVDTVNQQLGYWPIYQAVCNTVTGLVMVYRILFGDEALLFKLVLLLWLMFTLFTFGVSLFFSARVNGAYVNCIEAVSALHIGDATSDDAAEIQLLMLTAMARPVGFRLTSSVPITFGLIAKFLSFVGSLFVLLFNLKSRA